MGKKKLREKSEEKPVKKRGRGLALGLCLALAAAVIVAAALLYPRLAARATPTPSPSPCPASASFAERSAALRAFVLGADESGDGGAQDIPGTGCVAFLSISDGETRAVVFWGVGKTARDAWLAAEERCLSRTDVSYEVKWLKADLLSQVKLVSPDELSALMAADGDGYFPYGLSLDQGYSQALLEPELNGCGIYDYDSCSVDLSALNARLAVRGDAPAETLPEKLRIFRTCGYFMDEDGAMYTLTTDLQSVGERRVAERVDAELVLSLADSTSQYILPRMQEDGSFNYGVYPATGEQIEGYSSLLHASSVWFLELLYRATGNEELLPAIDSSLNHLLSYVLLDPDGAAYLCEPESGEIKSGGGGLALVALTEYMDLTGDDEYLDVARALGDGLLAMQDQRTGQFCHIMDLQLQPVQQVAERYYDGAAVFGLCRLYGADRDPRWLSSARRGMDYMIDGDYAQYADQWASYAATELTRFLGDERYYNFGFENASRNLSLISSAEAARPEYLELMMSAFELYLQAKEAQLPIPESFELPALLEAIYARADRMLDGYFFPESAMYMESPSQIVDSFMVWDGVCRVRIDDVQHNLCAYYLYYKNYEALLEAGMKTDLSK